MRYDGLYRRDWARVFRDHEEPLTYVGGSGVSGATSGAVFENYSSNSDDEGGRSVTVSVSLLVDRSLFESGFGTARQGDTFWVSGTGYRVVRVDADPAALTIAGEALIKQETSPGQARRTR